MADEGETLLKHKQAPQENEKLTKEDEVKCCLCFNPKTGFIIVGVLNVIGIIIEIAVVVMLYKAAEELRSMTKGMKLNIGLHSVPWWMTAAAVIEMLCKVAVIALIVRFVRNH